MNTAFGILTLLAVAPGVIIIARVYRMDRIEKEPVGLILLLLILGGLVCFPVAEIEGVLISGLGLVLAAGTLFNLIENFLCVALVEELGKFLVLKVLTWRNRNFDYRFDALVYAISSALGFAVLENCFYVWEGGIQVALMRAVLSVPGHAMFGLFMGVSYALAKVADKHGNKAAAKWHLRKAVLLPTLLHGTYDFCLSQNTYGAMGIFIVLVAGMYIASARKLKSSSMADLPVSADL